MADKSSSTSRGLRHLISLTDIDRSQIEQILERARQYRPGPRRPAPQDDTMRGRTVANLFFEPSTRTRASFELAAKRLGADVLNLDVNMSSRAKGESLIDTIYTLEAMHIDVFVVRDASTGIPATIARQVQPHVCVLNAGESGMSHPTQGLLDLFTIARHKTADFSELKVAIVGDVRHSRVANSAYQALAAFGLGELVLVAPDELLPETDAFPGALRSTNLERGIRDADVVMALRLQRERFGQLADIPDPQAYFRRFGLTEKTLQHAKPDAIVMHPGPMNRGVEIESAVADGPQSVIREQVTNGLAVRMAVLSLVNEHISATERAQRA